MGASATRAGLSLVNSFDSIRIVNLAHRTDRRREVVQQLARLGLDLGGTQIALFAACSPAEPGNFPTRGARGCFESHVTLLTEAVEKGLNSILFLEDDVDFHADIETLLPAALDALAQTDWDIFYGSILPRAYTPTASPIELLDPAVPISGSHFYAMRGDVIKLAVQYFGEMASRPAGDDHPDGNPMHYDGALSVLRRQNPALRTYLANPDLAFQRLSRTDVHDLALYDRLPVVRDVAALLRRAIKALGFSRQLFRKP